MKPTSAPTLDAMIACPRGPNTNDPATRRVRFPPTVGRRGEKKYIGSPHAGKESWVRFFGFLSPEKPAPPPHPSRPQPRDLAPEVVARPRLGIRHLHREEDPRPDEESFQDAT